MLSNKIKERMTAGIPFCSIEVFPPSLEDRNTVLNRIQRLTEVCYPLFTAVACLKQPDPESLADDLSLFSKDMSSLLLHLPASELTKAQALKFLNVAKDIGINSIFALRGDIRKDHTMQADFLHAIDLVTFIRKHFGSYFTVCVAGYPEGHAERESDEQDLYFLKKKRSVLREYENRKSKYSAIIKRGVGNSHTSLMPITWTCFESPLLSSSAADLHVKVEAGADFIITQMFFKCETFIKYEQHCRCIGITVPIIPGIMPIKSYESLQQVTKRCNVAVPLEILEALEPIRGNKEKVQDFGTHLAAQMVHRLLPISNAVHFFTLNSDQTADVCKLTLFNDKK